MVHPYYRCSQLYALQGNSYVHLQLECFHVFVLSLLYELIFVEQYLTQEEIGDVAASAQKKFYERFSNPDDWTAKRVDKIED